ncbi:MAG: hypothetical protein DRI28_02930 [Caldiserica bacterium]|nr:MAG: hypothetical protein DRI28_02930 [Caldisericota bacterium]
MRKHVLLGVIFLILFLSISGSSASRERVIVLHIEGEINLGLSKYVDRCLKDMNGVKAVIVEIDSFGGALDAATRIRDRIIHLDIPTIAWIKGRAWSAGALIALSCKKIVFSSGASMGAAEPIPTTEKTVSAVRGEFESTCEANGRDPKIGASMVDKEIEIEGVVKKGELLTLSSENAKKLGFSDYESNSLDDILSHFNLNEFEISDLSPLPSEKLAGFLTSSIVREILLIIGFLGLLIEATTPGFGIPGTMGLVALSLFFGGHMIAGIGNWLYTVMFVAGIVLLLIEIFVIPGFGIAGISGIALIFISIFLTLGGGVSAIYAMGVVVLVLLVSFLVLLFFFPKLPIWKKLGLARREMKKEGYVAVTEKKHLEGKEGKAITMLRPSGVVEIDGKRYDALTEGEFIERGQKIVVTRVEGGKIFVKKLK